MNDFLNLKGAKELSKNDQIFIKGGKGMRCTPPLVCIVRSSN